MKEKVSLLPKSVARFAAVQALFQIEETGRSAEDVIQEFLSYRFSDDAKYSLFGDDIRDIDIAHFRALVSEAANQREKMDDSIDKYLPDGWQMHRLEACTLALLRCGAAELFAFHDVPHAVVLNEYITIAHGFLTERGPGFVNAILARVATEARAASGTHE